jgi:hypothetical protein
MQEFPVNFSDPFEVIALMHKALDLGITLFDAADTTAKTSRRRISAACASVGALESGFTVEPCATIKSALWSDLTNETFNSLPRAQVEWGRTPNCRDIVKQLVRATFR